MQSNRAVEWRGESVHSRSRSGCQAYLPGSETDRDQEGGVSTARPIHCTPGGLTRTTTPNRGGSRAQFLLVGTSVRAVPLIESKEKEKHSHLEVV